MIPDHARVRQPEVERIARILRRTLLVDYKKALDRWEEGHGMPGTWRRINAQTSLYEQFAHRIGEA